MSSWTASSPAATSKVTLGWSLVSLRARLLPKLITLFPPPCMELMNRMKNNTMSRIGARVPSRSGRPPVSCKIHRVRHVRLIELARHVGHLRVGVLELLGLSLTGIQLTRYHLVLVEIVEWLLAGWGRSVTKVLSWTACFHCWELSSSTSGLPRLSMFTRTTAKTPGDDESTAARRFSRFCPKPLTFHGYV